MYGITDPLLITANNALKMYVNMRSVDLCVVTAESSLAGCLLYRSLSNRYY
jgi:hypothetical protein